MKHLALITAALVGMAGAAHAQPMGTPNGPAPYHHTRYSSPMMAQACGNRVAITDEYGFRYDGRGDRLNAQGCVIRPPHSLPGAKVIQG
jgi:hypothetical protein